MTVLNSLFLDYCILGGMPAVVAEYIERNTFEGSLELQQQLILDYKEDIRKYAEGLEQTKIVNVFNQIAPPACTRQQEIPDKQGRKRSKNKGLLGLYKDNNDSGIINICCLNFPELPLKGNYDSSKYKLYFADSGLLVSMLDEESQDDLRANRNLGVYKGALFENIVGEALVKSGYDLYYYKRDDSQLEEDFFVRTSDALVPVEVKATNSRSKSLLTLIKSEKYTDISYGIKFAGGNIGFANNIYTFPYFCILLKRYMKIFSVEKQPYNDVQ